MDNEEQVLKLHIELEVQWTIVFEDVHIKHHSINSSSMKY